jgi:hypothetical protein
MWLYGMEICHRIGYSPDGKGIYHKLLGFSSKGSPVYQDNIVYGSYIDGVYYKPILNYIPEHTYKCKRYCYSACAIMGLFSFLITIADGWR